MRLVDFDKEVLKVLQHKGFTHAVIKPIMNQGTIQTLQEEGAIEVVPFFNFEQASHYLDGLEPECLTLSSITEMTDKLADPSPAGHNKGHLLVDIETVGLKESYHN